MTRTSGFIFLLPALFSASAAGQVTYQNLLKADPVNWLTYSGSYNSQRHSLLKQVDTGNAYALTPKWIYHVPGAGKVESVPIVVDGVMYVSQPNEVYALIRGRAGCSGNIATSRRWKGPNRGVAVYATSIFHNA
jgi:hypothetical protein